MCNYYNYIEYLLGTVYSEFTERIMSTDGQSFLFLTETVRKSKSNQLVA